jgi:UPF0176 protein
VSEHLESVNDNLQQSARPIKVAAFYKFITLSGFHRLQPVLAKFCCSRGIRGTILLAGEGINGTVAGAPETIDALIDFLHNDALLEGRFAGAEIKFSTAERQPFHRMKVRLKDEIVTLRAPEANPAKAAGTYVAPEDWNSLLARDDVLVIDTRNAYEVGLGTFAGALDPGTESFTEFKDFVTARLDPARDKRVAMFCTGGIRCEKASSYLLSKGFEEVYHLKGGILAYLETVPAGASKFEGECFVFDERVAVTHGLAQGEASLCRACRNPLTAIDRTRADYVEGISCRHCADVADRSGATERHRQVALAEARGEAHLGDAAKATATSNRAKKLLIRARSTAA